MARELTIGTDTTQELNTWLARFASASPVVVVPVYNAFDDVRECVESLLVTTPGTTPIVVIDDASTDSRLPQWGAALVADQGDRLAYVRKPTNTGFVGSANLGFTAARPHDVVLVNSDIVLPERWLERLQAAAYPRTNVATVTPFTDHGTMVSVPYRNRPLNDLVDGLSLAETDARIEQASTLLRPTIPTAICHCTYFRRSALDAVGHFDEAFAPGYGEEVDFSQRALSHGFVHLVADDLFVYHKGSRSFDAAGQLRRERLQIAHDQLIHQRYPWYMPWMRAESQAMRSPLAQALTQARRALLPTRIAVDATHIAPTTTGTSVVALEFIRALGTAPQRSGELIVVVRDGTMSAFRQQIGEYVDDIYTVDRVEQMAAPVFDLVFRPSQVQTRTELNRLQWMADRFVVFQLDFIAYADPAYAQSYEAWLEYRRLTALTLATADGVAYLSADVMADGTLHGLAVPPERTCVLYSGVDHHFHQAQATPRPPARKLDAKPFILMLGTNFLHKNRRHTLLVFERLVTQMDWQGTLVLAGPRVSAGGSVAEESLILAQTPAIADRVLDLGEVDEAEKAWLLQHAAVVLYPSVCEGFGLIPFEAAAYGTPTVATRSTALHEILGDDLIYFDAFDAEVNARCVWQLLTDEAAAQRQVRAIRRPRGTLSMVHHRLFCLGLLAADAERSATQQPDAEWTGVRPNGDFGRNPATNRITSVFRPVAEASF